MRAWFWTKRALLGLCVLAVATAGAGAVWQAVATRRDLAATPPPGRLVDVGGHRLHVWCTGSGEPTVILEAGLGGSVADWGFVQPEVARFTRVCAYDRAGMGYSDPGPTPRTARRAARELRRLLDAAGVTTPVVLVGASLGGLTARVFASEHPERAAALVLVDASHEDQQDEVPRIARVMPVFATLGLPRLLGFSLGLPAEAVAPDVRGFARATRFRTSGYRAAADELLHLAQTADEVRATRRELPIPIVVVTAGRGADAGWRRLQEDQVRLSPRACQVVAERSAHAVTIGQPEVVVAAIRATVDAVRGRHAARPCA